MRHFCSSTPRPWCQCAVRSVLCVTGANVLASDEEGETCLHLAFARHTAAVNLDQADLVSQVFCEAVGIFYVFLSHYNLH